MNIAPPRQIEQGPKNPREPPDPLRRLLLNTMRQTLPILAPALRRSLPLAVALLSCAALLVGSAPPRSANPRSTLPDPVESEKDSRGESSKTAETSAALAHAREHHRALPKSPFARLRQKTSADRPPPLRPRSLNVFFQDEHDLQNGIGAPLRI